MLVYQLRQVHEKQRFKLMQLEKGNEAPIVYVGGEMPFEMLHPIERRQVREFLAPRKIAWQLEQVDHG